MRRLFSGHPFLKASFLGSFFCVLFVFFGGCPDPFKIDCRVDSDCSVSFPICLAGKCRICRTASDCLAGQTCVGNACLGTSQELAGEKREEAAQDGRFEPLVEEASQAEEAFAQDRDASQEATTPPEGLIEKPLEARLEPPTESAEGLPERRSEVSPEGSLCLEPMRPCYTGPAGTEGKGPCKAGSQTCQGGVWGPCTGEIKPGKERCNLKDDDCDGKVDEEYPGYGSICTVGVGECRNSGIFQCKADGSELECSVAPKAPGTEVCASDGKDEDCDGKTDEGCACQNGQTQPCGNPPVGLCKKGTQACQNGVWGPCTGEIQPATEICDDRDNDCDGKADEALARPCISGTNSGCTMASGSIVCKGECRAGTQSCRNGAWLSCTSEIVPSPEICDGSDNDCDGLIDEGVETQPCYTGPAGTQGIGRCKAGELRCIQGRRVCVGDTVPIPEECNLKDDDCDGKVDEGLPSGTPCYYGPQGTQGVGLCKSGTIQCVKGVYDCVGMVLPSAEVCGDRQDSDCNGRIDDCYGTQIKGSFTVCAQGSCSGGTCAGETQVTCNSNGACQRCDTSLGGIYRCLLVDGVMVCAK